MASEASPSLGGAAMGGAAMEKIMENITDTEIGMPRLPQAAPRKATKLATTSSTVSCSGCSCSTCTAQNSGGPISAAGSSCQNLPRLGLGWSGGIATITPTEAVAAAKLPRKAWASADTSSSPTAAMAPFMT